jgi:hypothetical protein
VAPLRLSALADSPSGPHLVQRVAHIVREDAKETIAVARCPVGKAPGNFGDSLVSGIWDRERLAELVSNLEVNISHRKDGVGAFVILKVTNQGSPISAGSGQLLRIRRHHLFCASAAMMAATITAPRFRALT